MYAIGEKYGISGLKSLVKEKFEAAVQHIWCGSTFYSVVRFIYGSTDGGLRDVISSLAHRNVASLKTQPDFAEMLEEFPSFTLNLLWEMMGKSLQEEEEKAILSPAHGSHDSVC
ncbi:BTB/POZ domain-containing protein [Histoplasma capsulatum var. duboisii H88]|nr:BTB/POZ domain-containing protein [Histoplasma capsulatum var. duboisii H88]